VFTNFMALSQAYRGSKGKQVNIPVPERKRKTKQIPLTFAFLYSFEVESNFDVELSRRAGHSTGESYLFSLTVRWREFEITSGK